MSAAPLAPDAAKRLATAQAKLALAGVQVRQLAMGGYWAWSVGRARFCPELEDLEAYATQVSKERP